MMEYELEYMQISRKLQESEVEKGDYFRKVHKSEELLAEMGRGVIGSEAAGILARLESNFQACQSLGRKVYDAHQDQLRRRQGWLNRKLAEKEEKKE